MKSEVRSQKSEGAPGDRDADSCILAPGSSAPGRVAVYTALCGPKSRVVAPLWRPDYVDYICFTDQPAASIPAPWQVRPLESCSPDPNRTAKRYKVLPHWCLPEYATTIWVDANFRVTRGFEELLPQLAATPLLLFRHFERDCAYAEAEVCKAMGLDDPVIIDAQMARYRALGFPENFGLGENGTLLRRNTPEIRALMQRWWEEIQQGSRRDQLSLMPLVWQNVGRASGPTSAALDGSTLVKILPRTARDGYHHEWLPHLNMRPLRDV
jgi:hypothetical protein